ncbi:MAG TPA: hypothetical protein VM509_16090 [Planctomycetota bacterium]|nr:hypothetical protein [Planctomycetota bacterium]
MLFGACSKANVAPAFSGTKLTLAEMQAKYPCVASPPPEWKLQTAELRGESFELFDGAIIFGVFHVPSPNAVTDYRTTVHLVAPTSRVKLAWSIAGVVAETTTFGPTTKGDASAYFSSSLHGSTISVELQEIDGARCSRTAQLRIR